MGVVYGWDSFQAYAGGDYPLAVKSVHDKYALSYPHSHVFHELAIITGGTGVYRSGDLTHQLKTGDVFLLPPGVEHHYAEQIRLRVTNVLWNNNDLNFNFQDLALSPGFTAFFQLEPNLRKRQKDNQCLSLDREQLDIILTLVVQMQQELQRKRSGFILMAISILGQIFTHICRYYANQGVNDYHPLLVVEKELNYIAQHYMDPIRRKTLAKHANMSETTFFRQFKAVTDQSPTEYLLAYRLQKAAEYLRASNIPLAEIAIKCGLSDSSYLGMQFKKHYHQTPHNYRINFNKI